MNKKRKDNDLLWMVKLGKFPFFQDLGVKDFKQSLTARPKHKFSLNILRSELGETNFQHLGVSSKPLKKNREKLETLQDDQAFDRVLVDKIDSKHIKANSNLIAPNIRLKLNNAETSTQVSHFKDLGRLKNDVFLKELKSDDRNFIQFPDQKLVKYQSDRKLRTKTYTEKSSSSKTQKSRICVTGEKLLNYRIK